MNKPCTQDGNELSILSNYVWKYHEENLSKNKICSASCSSKGAQNSNIQWGRIIIIYKKNNLKRNGGINFI